MCFSRNQFKILETLVIFSVESRRKIHFTSNWSISTTIASLCQQWMVCKELSSFRLPKMQIQFGGFALRVQAWKRIEKRNHDSGPSLKIEYLAVANIIIMSPTWLKPFFKRTKCLESLKILRQHNIKHNDIKEYFGNIIFLGQKFYSDCDLVLVTLCHRVYVIV